MFRAAENFFKYGPKLDTSLKGADYLNSPSKKELDAFLVKVSWPLAKKLILLSCYAVHRIDGDPAMVQLPRVGQNGEDFDQLKIRTMKVGSEKQPLLLGMKKQRDPRITPLGRIMRKWSLDELPQVSNVANDEMSWVGPRPKSREEFEALSAMDPEFDPSYTLCKGGITGLEQIYGRGTCTPQQRIDYAKEYAEEGCVKLDRQILRLTGLVVLGQQGAY